MSWSVLSSAVSVSGWLELVMLLGWGRAINHQGFDAFNVVVCELLTEVDVAYFV